MRKMWLPWLFLGCTCAAQTVDTATPAAQPPAPKRQEQVVVTGTYTPVPLQETDRSVDVFEVNHSRLFYTSPIDVLEQDSSVDVQQRVPGSNADVSIRGSSFEQALILVNGLRINDVQTGHNNLDLPFPMEAIERIEVLKGSGSTMYGSDAIGGAVNYITCPPEHSEIRLGAAGGSWSTNEQYGSLSYASKRIDEQLAFGREASAGFMPDRDYRNLAGSSETDLTTALGRTALIVGASDRPFGANQFYGPYDSWERTKGWFTGLTQDLGQQTSVAFGFRRHTDEFVLLRDDPAVYENNHVTDQLQLALRRFEKLGKNTRIYYGAEGYRDTIDSSNLGQHQRNQGAVYAAVDARALGRFSLTAGAREDIYSGGNAQFSPSVAAGYWLTHRLKLHGNVSHAFRLPSFTDLYYHDPANIGNANLRPEYSWDFEGGLQATFSNALTAGLTVFHRNDHDVIDYERSNINAPWMAENIDQLHFTGVEASLRWQAPKRQRVELSYTFLNGVQGSLMGEQTKYVFNYPVNNANVTLWSVLPWHLQSRFRLAALQRYQRDAYPLLECAVTREFKHVHPYVQLTNLTNTQYEEIPGVPMQGRGVLAGMEVSWSGK